MKGWLRIRDVALFFIGSSGVLHEIWLTHLERPTVLIVCAGFMGLPVFLNVDERRGK